MSPLTAEAALALPGPAWLKSRRADAFERFAARGLPNRDEEVWKYSRIFSLDLDELEPAPDRAPASDLPASLRALVAAVGDHAALVVVRDGRIASVDVDAKLGAAGLEVGDVADRSDGEGLLGRTDIDAFTELNGALAPSPLVVSVPRGLAVEAPVVILHWASESGVASFPRTVIRAGENSQVSVVEYHGSEDVRALTVPLVEIDAADAAIVRYVGVEDLGPRMWQVAYQVSRTGSHASVSSANVSLGGDYARLRVDAHLDGEGSSADLVAVYFGDGTQMQDFRTMQDHSGRRTTSDLLFKGAVTDLSHAVYTGLIRVNPGASGTSAFLTNRNIVLSEGARAYSVPNLEIVNENDLRNCGHASASGPIDEDQIFYLESRGVPREMAERLIVMGFFDDILVRTPLPALRAFLRQAVVSKLDRVLP